MAKSTNGWKTCSRGHKYRGAGPCPKCWHGKRYSAFLGGVAIVMVLATTGCEKAGTPTSPGTPVATTVTGIITGRIPSTNPVADAVVEVIEGPGTGTKATTGRDGRFTLSVPPGGLRLKVSRFNFQTWESASLTAIAQQAVTIPTVLLTTAPWALSGEVTDSLGRPFAGVQIRVETSWITSAGTLTTDAAGRYRLASTGETIELPAATISYDNGTTHSVYLPLTSNAPDVLTTGRGSTGFTIRAVSEGIATVAVDYRGVPATIDIRVER